MTTKPDKNQQNPETAAKLTNRQIKALPFIVASPTFTEGFKKAGVDRTVFYDWPEDPAFKAELQKQQKAISDQALGILAQNVTRAVERLSELIDDDDKRLARFAAKDLLDYHVKYTEVQDIEARVAAIEDKLNS